MFQVYVSKHVSPFTSTDVFSSVAPAANPNIVNAGSITVGRSTFRFASSIGAASNGQGFAFVQMMDPNSPDSQQVFSVAASLSFSTDSNYIPCVVRFESSASQPSYFGPSSADFIPLEASALSPRALSVRDCVTVDVKPRSAGMNVFVGVVFFSASASAGNVTGVVSMAQVDHEVTALQPLK